MSGQRVFDSSRFILITDCGFYVVVFNMEQMKFNSAQCIEGLHYWLNTIIMYTYDAATDTMPPLAIVGTRKDAVSDASDHEAISDFLYREFHTSKAWKFVMRNDQSSTSSRSTSSGAGGGGRGGTGGVKLPLHFFPVDNTIGQRDESIQQLMRLLETTIVEFAHVKKQVPLSWLACLDRIHEQKRSYVMYDEMVALGAKSGIPEAEIPTFLRAMNKVATFFHLCSNSLRLYPTYHILF